MIISTDGAFLKVLHIFRDLDMSEYLSSEPSVQEANKHRCYDLVANISHGGEFISDKRGKRILIY